VRPVLPLALWAVAKGTPGVSRFQLLQTAPATLSVRLETAASGTPPEDEPIWLALRKRLRALLADQGLPNVAVERATEPPQRDPRSGKFRHVWIAPGAGEAPPSPGLSQPA
jgi:phenylacetate-CoA ligase